MNSPNAVTPEQTKVGLAIVVAVAETIRESKRVPSGVVYAALVGRVSLEGYNTILSILKGAGLIQETNSHELVWVGPEVQ